MADYLLDIKDILAKEERHRLKAERKGHRPSVRQRRTDGSNRSEGGSGRANSLSTRSLLDGIRLDGMLMRRRRNRQGSNEAIEMDEFSPAQPGPNRHITISDEDPRATPGARQVTATPTSSVSTSSRTPTLNPPTSLSNALMYPFIVMQIYIRRLRQGHEAATKAKALDRVERRERAFNSKSDSGKAKQRARKSAAALDDDSGWGLGSFGIRQAEEARERIGQSRRILREGLLIQPPEETEEYDDEVGTPGGSRRRRGNAPSYPEPDTLAHQETDLSDAELGQGRTQTPLADELAFAALEREVAEDDDDAWVDEAIINIDAGPARRTSPSEMRRSRRNLRTSRAPPAADIQQSSRAQPSDVAEGVGNSWSWWGPFSKWRLVDRSNY